MSLSLTLVSDGATINATTLRQHVTDIETYVNEGMAAGDLAASGWVDSVQIFGAAFFGGSNPRTRFETGTTHYNYTSHDKLRRTIHHYSLGQSAYLPIEGLVHTFVVDENLQSGVAPYYRGNFVASFYAFEYGGDAATPIDNSTDRAADFVVYADTTSYGTTARRVFKSSRSAPATVGAIYARQNHAVFLPLVAGAMTAGVHSVGVYVQTNNPAATTWQHVFVGGRTSRLDWHYR